MLCMAGGKGEKRRAAHCLPGGLLGGRKRPPGSPFLGCQLFTGTKPAISAGSPPLNGTFPSAAPWRISCEAKKRCLSRFWPACRAFLHVGWPGAPGPMERSSGGGNGVQARGVERGQCPGVHPRGRSRRGLPRPSSRPSRKAPPCWKASYAQGRVISPKCFMVIGLSWRESAMPGGGPGYLRAKEVGSGTGAGGH